MAYSITAKPNTTAPDADFPFGNIKDNDGSNNGTPVNVLTNGDIHQFFAKMAYEAGVTLNDLPDSEYSGWQFFEAMRSAVPKKIVKEFWTEGDGAVLTVTRAEMDAAMLSSARAVSKSTLLIRDAANANPEVQTPENPFVDVVIKMYIFITADNKWIDTTHATGNTIEISETTGNINITYNNGVFDLTRVRVVIIG